VKRERHPKLPSKPTHMATGSLSSTSVQIPCCQIWHIREHISADIYTVTCIIVICTFCLIAVPGHKATLNTLQILNPHHRTLSAQPATSNPAHRRIGCAPPQGLESQRMSYYRYHLSQAQQDVRATEALDSILFHMTAVTSPPEG